MAARVWPVDAVGGAPSYTGRALRQTGVSPSVAQASGSRPLGGLSGVRPGTPTTIVTATSTTWTVTPFPGMIDGEAAAIAGVYSYAFDTNQTGSVTAAAGSARVDRLDVQVSDPAESDGSSNPGIAIVRTDGTPGSGVPASAPPRSHPLALINVPASGGGSPTVSWNATYYCAPGGFVPFNTLAGLQAWTTAAIGQHATVLSDPTTQYNGDYVFNGTSWDDNGWTPYTPTTAGLTLGNGTLDSQYMRRGDYVEVEGSVVFGSTTSIPGPGVTISLPFPAAAKYNVANVAFAAGIGGAILSGGAYNSLIAEFLGSNTAVTLAAANATGTYVNQTSLSSTIPITWTTNAVLSWKFSYRTA